MATMKDVKREDSPRAHHHKNNRRTVFGHPQKAEGEEASREGAARTRKPPRHDRDAGGTETDWVRQRDLISHHIRRA